MIENFIRVQCSLKIDSAQNFFHDDDLYHV